MRCDRGRAAATAPTALGGNLAADAVVLALLVVGPLEAIELALLAA